MNMKELLAYSAEQKKLKAQKWNKERGNELCYGLTNKEYDNLSTPCKKAKGTSNNTNGYWKYYTSKKETIAFPTYY